MEIASLCLTKESKSYPEGGESVNEILKEQEDDIEEKGSDASGNYALSSSF